jgi:hypothetical protein
MPRKSYDEEFDFDEDDYEDDTKRNPRRFRVEEKRIDKKKKWDRESPYSRSRDYEDRR